MKQANWVALGIILGFAMVTTATLVIAGDWKRTFHDPEKDKPSTTAYSLKFALVSATIMMACGIDGGTSAFVAVIGAIAGKKGVEIYKAQATTTTTTATATSTTTTNKVDAKKVTRADK